MTPEARTGAPFELLRFTAAPVTGALVVLELDGRFHLKGRFARKPHLVIEPGEGRRIELAPVRTEVDGTRWHGTYAVPADALTDAARMALGVRGTLLELPAPDEPDDGERMATLAREANRLRRALERAEEDAASARGAAAAAAAALEAAVASARAEAGAQSAERIDALEHEVVEAHRLAALDVEEARTTAIADATARAEVAEQHAEEAETRARAAEDALGAAQARAEAAEAARAETLERAKLAEQELADARERADLAEQAAQDAVAASSSAARDDAADDIALTAEMAASVDAEARAAEFEQEADTLRERLKAAEAGTDVLRAELAEERERLAELAVERDPDATRPFTTAQKRDDNGVRRPAAAPAADAEARRRAGIFDPLPADAPEHERHGPHLSPWIAVGALLLFALALILLLFGG